MNTRLFLRAAVLTGLLLSATSLIAQVTSIRSPVARPQIAIAYREPALYLYDEYRYDGNTYSMHYMDNFAGSAHSRETMPGIQGIGADRRGNVYAAVWVGPSQPSYVMQMRKAGRFEGPLKRATAVATDNQGRIYITDADLGQIIRIDDLTGKNMITFGSLGSSIGQLKYPHGIAVDRQGRIYIADIQTGWTTRLDDISGAGRILLHENSSGKLFRRPSHIAVFVPQVDRTQIR